MSDTEAPLPPTERKCELCGRHDVWNDTDDHWRVTDSGRVNCIHEWDINGTYDPFVQQ